MNRSSIACSLDRENLAERRQRWFELGARAAVEVAATDRGLRLAFRADEGVEDELRRLAELERGCCAFADWSVTATSVQILLDVSGSSEEAVAAVQAMFGRLRRSSPRAAISRPWRPRGRSR